jgi:membrane protein implicated in regulation of membrane protease activity
MNADPLAGPLSWIVGAVFLASAAIFVFDLAPQWLGFVFVVIGTTITIVARRHARR